MAVSPADVRVIVERVCARPDVLDACARRDLGAVISALGSGGLTQGQIAALTGISQGRLSEWVTGKRKPKAVTTFQKFADGVGLAARRAPRARPRSPARSRRHCRASRHADVAYPDGAVQATAERLRAVARRPEPTLARSSAAGPTRARGMTPRFGGSSIPAACPSEPARGVRIGTAT